MGGIEGCSRSLRFPTGATAVADELENGAQYLLCMQFGTIQYRVTTRIYIGRKKDNNILSFH